MRLIRYSYPSSRSLTPGSGRFSPSPWSGLETEIDRLFTSALGELANPPVTRARFPVDLYEDKDNLYLRAELPGVARADINVEMVEDYLTLSGSRKTPAAEGSEEEAFSFARSISIPESVQSEKVTAAFENGVLLVTLPKREEAKPRKVTIEVK